MYQLLRGYRNEIATSITIGNYGDLTVGSGKSTALTGSVQVDGASAIDGDFSVENMSSTFLSGSLMVDINVEADETTNLNDFLNMSLYPIDKEQINISPLGGQMVFFRSDLMEHEVHASSTRERRSIATWLKN